MTSCIGRAFCAAWFAVASITGCGGGSQPNANPATATAADFERARAELECQQYLQCDTEDPSADSFRASGMLSDCVAENMGFPPYLEAFLADGTVEYDRSAADECLAAYDILCAGGPLVACRDALVGTVADGGGCIDHIQCQSHQCTGNGDACGTCLAALGLGEACNTMSGGFCAAGSYCATDLGTDGYCTAYDYVTTLPTQVGLGAECGADARCEPDLHCDGTAHCAARLAAGSVCDPDADSCAAGLVCADGGQGTSYCYQATMATTDGAPCGVVGPTYVDCDASARLLCASTGFCVTLVGTGAVGDACADHSQCDSGLCYWLNNQCMATDQQNGESCEIDEQCRSGFCSSKQCAPLPTCP